MACSPPCTFCLSPVYAQDHAVSCDICERWQHIKCGTTGITRAEYKEAVDENRDLWFTCGPCESQRQLPLEQNVESEDETPETEGLPDVNFTEPLSISGVQPQDSPSIVLASSSHAEAGFNLEIVKRCFEQKGLQIQNTTLLHGAAGFGDLESVKYLIQQDVDVNITDETTGCISLHNAVCHNHYAVAEYLIKNGAAVNKANKKGDTPMHSAALSTDWNVYQLLIKNGGDNTKENALGVTPEALFQNQKKLCENQGRQSKVADKNENSSNSLFNQLQNTDDQRPSRRDLGLGPQQKTLEITTEKGSKAQKRRSTSREQHPDKPKQTKRKKAVHLREKAPQRALDDNEDSTVEYSPETQWEMRLSVQKEKIVMYFKRSANPNPLKIVDQFVNDGSHKPPETSTSPVPETLQILGTETCVSFDTTDDFASPDVTLGHNSGPNVKAEQAESQIPHEDQSYLKTDKKNKMDVVKKELGKFPDKQKKTFVKHLTRILQTGSGLIAEAASSESQSDASLLLPDFDKLGLEEDSNS